MCCSVAERVEAGEERHRQPPARGVEPERRGPGQDADAVPRPDRVPVLDALGVVPHPVAVDHVSRRRPARSRACARRRGPGRRRSSASGGVPSRSGQLRAHELVVAADAAGGDDHRAGRAARTRRPPRASSSGRAPHGSGASTAPRDAVDRARGHASAVDAVAEAQLDEAARCASRTRRYERLDRPGPGAPGDVEARHGVAVPGRERSRRARPSRRSAGSGRPCACSHARFSPAAKST